jgi:low affinity Fe/Cu permease
MHRYIDHYLEQIAKIVTRWTGTSIAFVVAVTTILVWLITGPIFRYSDTWQLVINTGTTIITFLMVFLIQRAQNKNDQVINIKLDELLAAGDGASNRLIDIENLGEQQIDELYQRILVLKDRMAKETTNTNKHSIEEVIRDSPRNLPAS